MKQKRTVAYYAGICAPRTGRIYQTVHVEYDGGSYKLLYKSYQFGEFLSFDGNMDLWRVILQAHFGQNPGAELLAIFEKPVGIQNARITPEELDEYIANAKRKGLL